MLMTLPFHVACGFGHLDVVGYLVDEQSVDPAGVSSDNVTPLHVACGMGHLEVVKFLIREGMQLYTNVPEQRRLCHISSSFSL